MEFAQEIGQDDPFAGSDFGDFEQPAPATPAAEEPPAAEVAPAPGASAEIPVVDREGEPVVAAPAMSDEQAAAEAARYDEQHALAQPEPSTPVPGPSPEGAAALETMREHRETVEEATVQPEAETVGEMVAAPVGHMLSGATLAAAPEPTPEPVAEADPTPPSSPQSETAASSVEAETEVATEPDPTPAPTDSGADTSSVTDGEEDAPEPEERKDKNNRVTKRRYLIYRPKGTDELTQVAWYEDKQGNVVEKGTPGAKRQKVLLARDTDDALAFGYGIVGAPVDGVRLVAVAALHFQPKMVKPKPVQPTKTRLQIG